MENNNIRIWMAISCLSLLALGYSCTDDGIDNTDGHYPIMLTLTVNGNSSIHLEWTSTRVSDFDRYVVARSTEPIPDDILPNALISIAEIEDLEETTFDDLSFPVADEIYYKVYANIGDHWVFSQTEIVRPDLTLFDAIFMDGVVDTDKNELYFLDQNQRRLIRYNYVSNDMTIEQLDWFPNRISYLHRGDQSEIYIFAINDFRYEVYDPASLTMERSVFMDRSISDILPSKTGFTYVSNRSFTQNLYVIDQTDHSVLHRHSLRQNTDFSVLTFMDTEQNIVVEASRQDLNQYEMSTNGNVLTRKVKNVGFKNIGLKQTLSPDRQFIFPYADLSYYDQDLNEINDDINSFFQTKTFSEDGNRLFASMGDNSVIEFEFPGLNEIKVHPLIAQPVFMFSDENKLFIVENVFTNQGESKVVIQNMEL